MFQRRIWNTPRIIINKNNYHPIHVASLLNNIEILNVLLTHKANVNIRDDKRASPLYMAVVRGNVEATKILLAHHVYFYIYCKFCLSLLIAVLYLGEC